MNEWRDACSARWCPTQGSGRDIRSVLHFPHPALCTYPACANAEPPSPFIIVTAVSLQINAAQHEGSSQVL